MHNPDQSGRKWRNRLLLLAGLVLAGAMLALFQPGLAATLALLTIVGLGWERLRLERDMGALATHIRTGNFDSKLEVDRGSWGEVCHAVNGLLQQQRRERRLRRLVPPLPLSVAEALSAAHWPGDGIRQPVVVLALGLQARPGFVSTATIATPSLNALRLLGAASWNCAHTYRALPERYGNVMLLCFGAFDDNYQCALRDALQSARTIRQQLRAATLDQQLRCGLAGGNGHISAAIEIGTRIDGPPRDHALELQQLAAGSPVDWLLCSEEIYLQLYSDQPAGPRRPARPQSRPTANTTRPRAYALEAGKPDST
jgi:hypothetical protein